MRFGMGLLNIQGQVQGIAVGLLLILSILIPNLVRNIPVRSIKLKGQSVMTALVLLIIFALFLSFFFWSRAPIISAL
jgi:Ca2+/H+ antiporter